MAGERTHVGNVVRNCFGDRIQVRNAATDKVRFIDASQVVS
jgi:hypothetical protein